MWNYIKIPNIFVQEYKYTNETVYIYGLLQKWLTGREQIIFTLNGLFESINISGTNKKSRDRIKLALKELGDDGYIKFNCKIEDVNVNKMIFSNFTNIEHSYVKILDREFDAISNYKDVDIYKLFCVFASIKSRMNNGYCYPSYKTIRENTNIKSDTSINDYLKILKELELIIYSSAGLFANKNNKVVNSNNIYAMFGDDKILELMVLKRKNKLLEFNRKINDSKDTNKNRSDSMKKYWAKKKGIDVIEVDPEAEDDNDVDFAEWEVDDFNIDETGNSFGKVHTDIKDKFTEDFIDVFSVVDEVVDEPTEREFEDIDISVL